MAVAKFDGKSYGFEYVKNNQGDIIEIQNKFTEKDVLLSTIVTKIGELRDRADFVSARRIDASVRGGEPIGAFNSKGATITLSKKLEAETCDGQEHSFEEKKLFLTNYELRRSGQIPEFKEYMTEFVSKVGKDKVSVLSCSINGDRDVRFCVDGKEGSMNADVFYFYRGAKNENPQVGKAIEVEEEVMDLRKAIKTKPCLTHT